MSGNMLSASSSVFLYHKLPYVSHSASVLTSVPVLPLKTLKANSYLALSFPSCADALTITTTL